LSIQFQNPIENRRNRNTETRPLTSLALYRHFNKKWWGKQVLETQTSPLSEMMRSWKCFSHVSKIPALTYNPAHIIRNSIILNIIHNILTLRILVLSKRGGLGGSMS
jgi:hypothetical protein